MPEKPTLIRQDGPTTLRAFYGTLETSFIRYTQVPAIPEAFHFGAVELPVADMKAIAAMKAAALHDRGQRRDFIDIHAITKQPAWSVARFIEHASTKLPLMPDQVARALTYFADADTDEDDQPLGYSTPWEAVKKDLVRGVQEWERDRREREAVERMLAGTTGVTDGKALHRFGIRPETIRDERFFAAVHETPDGTIVFAFSGGTGVVGALLQGQGNAPLPPAGRPERGVWSSAANVHDDVLVLVDSPVEALSYHQANPNPRARYVATGKDIKGDVEALIREAVSAMPSRSRLVLAFPRTSRGASLSARIEALVPERKPTRHLPQRGSSWSSYVQEQEREWIRAQGLRRPGRDHSR